MKASLTQLQEDSGTGPDLLSTRILKNCAKSLIRPITMLAREIMRTGEWPNLWKNHWVYPLHKKKSKSERDNYRGVHLTSQLSKVTERVLGRTFLPYLERIGAAGPCQFAYRKNRGLQDALAYLMMSWISSLSKGNLIGLSPNYAIFLDMFSILYKSFQEASRPQNCEMLSSHQRKHLRENLHLQ